MPTSTAKLVLNPSSKVSAPPPTPPSAPTGPPWRRMSRQDSVSTRNPPGPPPPPPPPPMAAPPPPPPPAPAKKANPVVVQRLENLRKMPRKRPDWNCLMKEIEKGLKLKKIESNDRSRPVLPQNKAKGKFVYDSEKANLHNQLLHEIQKGVRLKRSPCNDRSRPNIRGIGGFRRQVSVVEEPAAVVAAVEPAAAILEPEDDLDDIDKLRDDLQSTKQLLEIELKTKAKLESENSSLQYEIRKLKEELAKKAAAPPPPAAPQPAPVVHPVPVSSNHLDLKKSASRLFGQQRKRDKTADSDEDDEDEIDFGELEAIEEEMNTLRGQAELARSSAEQWESSYKEASQKLVLAQANMEDLEHKVTVLQKKLKKAQGGGGGPDVETLDAAVQTEPELWSPTPPPTQQDFSSATRRSASKRDLRKQMSRQDSRGSNLSSASLGGGDDMDGDSDGDEDEIDDVSKSQKRELSLLKSRLRSTKEKERNVRNERIALQQQQRKMRLEIKDEKKKLARLQKEVDRMAALLNEVEEESGKGEKVEIIVEEVEVTDDEEEADEEDGSDNEDDGESSDESGDEDIEDVPEADSIDDTESDEVETRITKLGDRVRNHDNVLSTLKKGNYLLKTRVEILQDELRNVRDRYVELEQELNTCLAELG